MGRASSPPVIRALAEARRHATDYGFSARVAARRCGVSTPYLLRTVRSELGVSFSGILRRHRVALACRRLATCDESIKEICTKVGYESCSRFIRDFKRECGTTPAAYRRREMTSVPPG